MNKLFIYPYVQYSKSAIELRKELDKLGVYTKIIKRKNSNYNPGEDKTVLNWGTSTPTMRSYQGKGPFINPVSPVSTCSNKLKFFEAIRGKVSCPEFTRDYKQAEDWVLDGYVVLSRTSLSDHSGKGIIFSDDNGLVESPLYVKYIPKKEEYRVHVFRGKVIDIQQKKLRKEDDYGRRVNPKDINFRVRSYHNGFIFARQEVNAPDTVTEEAIKAFDAIKNLDFGAFDVIYNKRQNQAYVLECNTAPGLEGTTVQSYARAIKEVL